MKLTGNLLILACLLLTVFSFGQTTNKSFTKADTLRGSITEYRKGWDVLKYNLDVKVDINNKSIEGSNEIVYHESLPVRRLQIDLQKPLIIDSAINESGLKLPFENEGNVWLVTMIPENTLIEFFPGRRGIKIFYHGTPSEAIRPPWDGGVVWKKDSTGSPWVATACEGKGASVWWPCKDHLSDEPDEGMTVAITAPDTLTSISNGRLRNVTQPTNGYKTWMWEVKNPINNYDVTMNIGKYTNWTDTLNGEKGKLDLQYWVLGYNLQKAKKQFAQVKPMFRSFERWFGPYPFYEDSYKLVETPFLGMEHQSAIAYGNGFENGYRGTDLSATGWGLKFDFIIVHESGHEWFGNNITAKDIADMWIHESFTNYSEVLFLGDYYGKEAGKEYCYGIRKKITNNKPIIGSYGVNQEGSGDMYYKGANMINIIRNVINNDEKFREILRGLNSTFYHQTVTTKQVEDYIISKSGINFQPVFNQYLRATQIPVLEYYLLEKKQKLFFRYTNIVKGFNVPIRINNVKQLVKPTKKWQSISTSQITPAAFKDNIEKDYYISVQQVAPKD